MSGYVCTFFIRPLLLLELLELSNVRVSLSVFQSLLNGVTVYKREVGSSFSGAGLKRNE